MYGNDAKCRPSLASDGAICKYFAAWGALSIAAHSFTSLKINWYVAFDIHCWITITTLMWQTQFSQLGYIRAISHFVLPVIIFLIAPYDCTDQLKWINLPSSSAPCANCCVTYRASWLPELTLCFCSILSGAVESNNCVSCSVIMQCSRFLSGLYWNLDPVPLQWLSPSVSEEPMLSPSPCEFPPLQLSFLAGSYLSFRHYIPSFLFCPLLPLFSHLSQFSYLCTSIALSCVPSA